MFKKNNLQKNKGFTLLLAMLIISVILAVGFSISNIAIKELELSSTSRGSHLAIFAADSGIECALLWDFRWEDIGTKPIFATSSNTQFDYAPWPPNNIRCLGDSLKASSDWLVTYPGVDKAITTFNINFGAIDEPCFKVTVEKGLTGPESTSIISRGYNNCDIGHPRRVERAIRVSY